MPTRRNPVVRYGALLRKGGAHTKSVSGERHQSRRQLDDEIDDYFNQRLRSQRKTQKEQDDSAPSQKKLQYNLRVQVSSNQNPPPIPLNDPTHMASYTHPLV